MIGSARVWWGRVNLSMIISIPAFRRGLEFSPSGALREGMHGDGLSTGVQTKTGFAEDQQQLLGERDFMHGVGFVGVARVAVVEGADPAQWLTSHMHQELRQVFGACEQEDCPGVLEGMGSKLPEVRNPVVMPLRRAAGR